MLRFLRIRNLAVIEAVEVEFEPGFNVLTGETGAGKSIVVEAVGLLLGGRASSDLVRTGEPQATIEAIFQTARGDEVLVRREITTQGRSRSFIDGALATAGALRELASELVEMHGQHEHQALLDPATHLQTIDHYAELAVLAEQVRERWLALRAIRTRLERAQMDTRERVARFDLVTVQLDEIRKASPRPGEDEELAAARQVLASAERIQGLCRESYAALYDRDDAVLAGLGTVWKRVGELAALDARFAPYVEARDAIKSQLEDLALFLRSYADSVDASPARLQRVEERLVLLERLKRRYGPTLQDVIAKAEALAQERSLLDDSGERLEDLQRELSKASAQYLDAARELSRQRRDAARRFSAALEAVLADLAMRGTRFEVRFETDLPEDRWGEQGIDAAEFYVSPNLGEDLRPLVRIVSGGELSRVMLALKTICAGPAAGRTLIFDEVDAGIGGRVADVVGARLQALGQHFQVVCITHLPQIAARGTTQFLIEKRVRGSRTVTSVQRLSAEQRVEELARMIGGASVSDPVRASARALLAGAKGESESLGKGESESRKRSRG